MVVETCIAVHECQTFERWKLQTRLSARSRHFFSKTCLLGRGVVEGGVSVGSQSQTCWIIPLYRYAKIRDASTNSNICWKKY